MMGEPDILEMYDALNSLLQEQERSIRKAIADLSIEDGDGTNEEMEKNPYYQVSVEDMGAYDQGWIDALKWVIQDKSQEEEEKICPDCDRVLPEEYTRCWACENKHGREVG